MAGLSLTGELQEAAEQVAEVVGAQLPSDRLHAPRIEIGAATHRDLHGAVGLLHIDQLSALVQLQRGRLTPDPFVRYGCTVCRPYAQLV